MKIKKIFLRRLAVRLRERGFKIIGTEVNFHRPQFDVYLFEDTQELSEAIEDLIKDKKYLQY